MDEIDKPGTEQDSGVLYEALESVALFHGVLRVCSLLETDSFAGEDLEPLPWAPLKRRLLGVLESLKIDTFLRALAPDEQLFKENIADRSDSDPHCFTKTLDRLVAIRKARQTFIMPLDESANVSLTEIASSHNDSSALEHLSRLTGVLSVLSRNERAHQQGAMPWETHSRIAIDVVVRDWVFFYVLSGMTTNNRVPAWNLISAEQIRASDTENHPQIAWVKQWMTEENTFFSSLLAQFSSARSQLFPRLASEFEGRLKAQSAETPEGQAERILYTLQERLIARRQAVEQLQYNRLETIDKNCEHLLATLKQYGIHATNYDEALRGYQERFAVKRPPQTDEESAIEREVQALEREVNWREVESRLISKHPKHVEFVQHKIRQRKEDEEGRRR